MRGAVLSAAILATALLAGCSGNPPEDAASDATAIEVPAVRSAGPRDTSRDVLCPEVARRMPPEMCEDYRELARQTEKGVGAFNAPSRMRVGKPVTVALAISYAPPPPPPSDTPATDTPASDVAASDEAVEVSDAPAASDGVPVRPKHAIRAGAAPDTQVSPSETVEAYEGPTLPYDVVVGPRMTATLTGEGFEISPRGPQPQDLTRGETIMWTWKVTPREEGVHILRLITAVEAPGPDGEHLKLQSTTRQAEIQVSIGFWGRLWAFLTGAPAWLKALTGVITALTALVVAVIAFVRVFRRKKDYPAAKPPP